MTEPADAPRLDTGRPAYYPTPTAYARDLGFSKQTATNWKREGLIVLVADPDRPGQQRVDTAASDAARAAQQNPLKRRGAVSSAAGATAANAASDAPDGDADAGELPLDGRITPADPHKQTAAAYVVKEKEIRVRNAELSLKERLGELCRTEDARAMVFRSLRLMRDTMQRLPMDAGEAANPDDPARAVSAIEAEVSRKLSALAIQIEALTGGGEVSGESEAVPAAHVDQGETADA